MGFQCVVEAYPMGIEYKCLLWDLITWLELRL